MSERILSSMSFGVTGTKRTWFDYGVTQNYGSFEGMKRDYQAIKVVLKDGTTQIITKSPGFIPIPTGVSRKITHDVAEKLGLTINKERDDGINYMASLTSDKIQGEVDVDDLVAWGITVINKVDGNFKIVLSLLRLACTNGMMRAEDSENYSIKKSYDIEAMKESFIEKASLLQDTFKEKLELFRSFKQYKMNQRFAESLAKAFPNIITRGIVEVGPHKVVKSFNHDMNLWQAYNILTDHITHRESLEMSTMVNWSLDATRIFEKEIATQLQDKS